MIVLVKYHNMGKEYGKYLDASVRVNMSIY